MMSPYEPGSQKRTSSVFKLLLQLCKRKWNHCLNFGCVSPSLWPTPNYIWEHRANWIVYLTLQLGGEGTLCLVRYFLHSLFLFPTIPSCISSWAMQFSSASLFSLWCCPWLPLQSMGAVGTPAETLLHCLCSSHCSGGILIQACPPCIAPEKCVSVLWDVALQLNVFFQ